MQYYKERKLRIAFILWKTLQQHARSWGFASQAISNASR